MKYDYKTNIIKLQKYLSKWTGSPMFWNYCRITNDLVEKRGNDFCSLGARQLTQFSLDSKILSDPNTLDPFASTHEPLSRYHLSLLRNRQLKSVTFRVNFKIVDLPLVNGRSKSCCERLRASRNNITSDDITS